MTEWQELVSRGRAASARLGQAKWELGDLADEVETTYNGGQLQTFAEEIGIEYNTLRTYRFVARDFDAHASNRGKAAWSVYRMLAGREDRYAILAEREYWTVNAMLERLGRPPQGYRTTDPDHVGHSFGKLAPQDRAKLVSEALNDPEIANEVSERVTDYVASDHGRIADVMAKRDLAGPHRTAEPREETPKSSAPRDYDRMVEQAVNALLVALVAERNGDWSPSATSTALLYFLPGMLADRHEPDGSREELVSDELAGMFDQLESYANQGGRDGNL